MWPAKIARWTLINAQRGYYRDGVKSRRLIAAGKHDRGCIPGRSLGGAAGGLLPNDLARTADERRPWKQSSASAIFLPPPRLWNRAHGKVGAVSGPSMSLMARLSATRCLGPLAGHGVSRWSSGGRQTADAAATGDEKMPRLVGCQLCRKGGAVAVCRYSASASIQHLCLCCKPVPSIFVNTSPALDTACCLHWVSTIVNCLLYAML